MAGDHYVPEHPLPQEIQTMDRDDTVCQFCGVSYLIHNEMKALMKRVEEAEKTMEYYKGSVEREEQLKIKVKDLENDTESLIKTLQASEERSGHSIFIALKLCQTDVGKETYISNTSLL